MQKYFSFFIGFILLLLSLQGYAQITLKGTPVTEDVFLSHYLQVASISGYEKEAGDFLRDVCLENNLHITQMGDSDGNYNIAASIRPLDENLPNIVFLNHIDVVAPGDSSKWTHPPFSGKITDKDIWGRGAFDNKGTAVMQLSSIIELSKLYKDKDIPYNVTFLAVSCEETQCDGGVKYVVEHYLEKLNPAVVIGEGPPALKGVINSQPDADFFGISVAHKRAFWLKLDLEIKTSGHASVTPDSYATKEMAKALSRLTKKKQRAIFNTLNVSLLRELGRLEKGITGFILRHPRCFKSLIVPKLRKKPELFALFSNTITITSLSSSDKVINTISNSASALLDCRLLPMQDRNKFLKSLKKKLDNDAIKITILNEMPQMPPSSEHSMYFQHLQSAISEKYPNGYVAKMFLPNFADTGIFRSNGVPAYSTVPVKIDGSYLEHIHHYNERIPRGIVKEGKSVYVNFVKKCMTKEKEK